MQMVLKRDGTQQPFDIEKIKRVVTAAGLTEADSSILIKNTLAWIEKAPNPTPSPLIGEHVLLELGKLDPYARDVFEWYESTKVNPPQSA